jgi:hypothetical protein
MLPHALPHALPQRNPHLMVNKLVAHFQQLFAVKDMQGRKWCILVEKSKDLVLIRVLKCT